MTRNKMLQPQRGEIWEVDWSPGRGSEQTGIRPALIIQNDFGNQAETYPNTIVATISTKGRPIPFHVLIRATKTSGLKVDSYVKCEQILTLHKDRLVGKALGRISHDEMRRVEEAILLSLGIKFPMR